MIQIQHLSRLSRFGIGSVVVAIVAASVYGAYHWVSTRKGATSPEAPKENNDEHIVPEADVSPVSAASEEPVVADHGDDPATQETVVVADEVADHSAQPTLTGEQQFFEDLWNAAHLTTGDDSFNHMLVAKFNTSEPRRIEPQHHSAAYRIMLFPIMVGVNVLYTERGDVWYWDKLEDKAQSIQFMLAIVNSVKIDMPENQALHYVHEKGRQLLNVGLGLLHPYFAYPKNFDTERGLAKNFQLKEKQDPKVVEFFDKVFAKANGGGEYLYTRGDMEYISAVVNSPAVEVPMYFANLEGDKFIYMGEHDALTNFVMVKRAVGYVQVFRGQSESILKACPGFENWLLPVGKVFNHTDSDDLTLALYLDVEVGLEVFTPVQDAQSAE